MLGVAAVFSGVSCSSGADTETERAQARELCKRITADATIFDPADRAEYLVELDPDSYRLLEGTELGRLWEEARSASEARKDDEIDGELFVEWSMATVALYDECLRILG
ncbi:MAG: hypothetical protein R2733_17195 [Acidimicrobiales bacterium]